ncbi:Filamin-C, partial [Nibea albiflora]
MPARATGRGLQPKGVRVKEVADFKVFTKGAGSGELNVSVKGPTGAEEQVKVRDAGNGVYECEYYPLKPGKYNSQHHLGRPAHPTQVRVPPFEVDVSQEAGFQKVRAWGPGLKTGMVGKSADFVVEAIGTDVGTLGFLHRRPAQARIECDDKADGSCDVRYWPTEPGDYAVHVICDDEDIKDSPFMAHILPAANDTFPEKIIYFLMTLVNCAHCYAPLGDISIGIKCAPGVVGPAEADIDFDIIKNDNDTFTVKYTPPGPGKYTIMVLFVDQEIPISPFKVKVDPSHDAGKEWRWALQPTSPSTQRELARPSLRYISQHQAQERRVRDFEIIDNHDYSYTVKVTWQFQSLMEEIQFPRAPFTSQLRHPLDIGKVKVDGLDKRVLREVTTHFIVDARALKKAGGNHVKVHIISPSGTNTESYITDKGDGTYRVEYTAFEDGCLKECIQADGEITNSLEVKRHIVGFARNVQWLVDHKADPVSQASGQTPVSQASGQTPSAKQVDRPRQPSKWTDPRQPASGQTPSAKQVDRPRQPSSGQTPVSQASGQTPVSQASGQTPSAKQVDRPRQPSKWTDPGSSVLTWSGLPDAPLRDQAEERDVHQREAAVVGYIFSGHTHSVRDLQKQISKTRGDYRLGRSLPSDYKYSDTVNTTADTDDHDSQDATLKGGNDITLAGSAEKEKAIEKKTIKFLRHHTDDREALVSGQKKRMHKPPLAPKPKLAPPRGQVCLPQPREKEAPRFLPLAHRGGLNQHWPPNLASPNSPLLQILTSRFKESSPNVCDRDAEVRSNENCVCIKNTDLKRLHKGKTEENTKLPPASRGKVEEDGEEIVSQDGRDMNVKEVKVSPEGKGSSWLPVSVPVEKQTVFLSARKACPMPAPPPRKKPFLSAPPQTLPKDVEEEDLGWDSSIHDMEVSVDKEDDEVKKEKEGTHDREGVYTDFTHSTPSSSLNQSELSQPPAITAVAEDAVVKVTPKKPMRHSSPMAWMQKSESSEETEEVDKEKRHTFP